MNTPTIEDELCKVLNSLENMVAMGICTVKEREKLKTRAKSWAYDQMKLNE